MWHVQLPRARPRDGGTQGDLLGQQQGKEEDRDADGEEEVKVPQDLPLVLCSQEIAGEGGEIIAQEITDDYYESCVWLQHYFSIYKADLLHTCGGFM